MGIHGADAHKPLESRKDPPILGLSSLPDFLLSMLMRIWGVSLGLPSEPLGTRAIPIRHPAILVSAARGGCHLHWRLHWAARRQHSSASAANL
jgi:hypothetical protein